VKAQAKAEGATSSLDMSRVIANLKRSDSPEDVGEVSGGVLGRDESLNYK